MPKQIGLVIQNMPKGMTEVLTDNTGACGGCQPTHGCHTCMSHSKVKARVLNPIGARLGDLVEIQLEQRAILQSALILFGLPLAGLIIGAALGFGWAAGQTLRESSAGVVFGLVGLVLGFGMAVWAGNSNHARKHLMPTITKVITPAVPMQPPNHTST